MTSDSPTSREGGPEPASGLARAAVGGVVWQGISYLSGKVMVLVTTVILARLLSPADFGVVGLALVFIGYAEVLTDLGVAEALVYFAVSEVRNDAALIASLAISLALTGAGVLVAPFVASFFHRPDIVTMFRVLALSLLIKGAGEVPDAILRKQLLFRKRLAADLSRVVGQGVISIVLALAGFGAWAIVWGYIASGFIWGAVAWALIAYRPSLRRFRNVTGSVMRPLLAFGLPAAGNAALLSLVFDIDYLIIGRVLGPVPLGYYTLGFRIPEVAIINVFYVLSSVVYPVFAMARGDRERLQRGYVSVVRFQSVYGAMAGAGLAAVAPMFVQVVFGAKWLPTVVPLEALALYAAFRALGVGAVDLYKAVGRPALAFWLSVARLACVLPALLIATRWGIVGVSWAQAVVAGILAILMQVLASVLLKMPVSRLAAALGPSVAAAVGTAGGALAVRLWLPGSDTFRLAAAVLAGAAGGLAALHLADRRFGSEVRELLRQRRQTRTTVAAPGPTG